MIMLPIVPLVIALGFAACPWARGQNIDPDFKPELVAVEFTAPTVRPGDPLAVTFKFRNNGTNPARADYRMFLHFTPATGGLPRAGGRRPAVGLLGGVGDPRRTAIAGCGGSPSSFNA